MLAILAAALLAAAPQNDTVFMADGGRVVGTVVEEAPQGVTVQLADGTVRRYPAREVLRIEYSDGSVTAPRHADAPAGTAAPAPAPAPSAQPPAAAPRLPPPPPAYTSPPPPAYSPPPASAPYEPRPHRAPPPYRAYPPPPSDYAAPNPGMAPISAVYGVLGFGGLTLSGDVEKGFPASQTFEPQVQLYFEGGLRLDPAIALGLYLDIGVGEPAAEVRAAYPVCAGSSCTATTGRVGILLRHTFAPLARTAPWIAVGTGFEFGSVTADASMGGSSSDLFSYSGWEAFRLMGGIDLRSSPVLGFGLYGAVSFGTYSRFVDETGASFDLGHQPYHTTVEAGLRMTLFP